MFFVTIQGTAVFPCYFCFGGGKIFPMLRSVLFTHKTILSPVCCLFFYEYFQLWFATNKCRRVTVKNVSMDSWSSFYSLRGSWQMKKRATWRSRNKNIRRKLKPVSKRTREIRKPKQILYNLNIISKTIHKIF